MHSSKPMRTFHENAFIRGDPMRLSYHGKSHYNSVIKLREISSIIHINQIKKKELENLDKQEISIKERKKELIKEYEIKTRHLRVYMFHEDKTGRIIVCGGKKTSQQKDIKRFRRIKKDFFNR